MKRENGKGKKEGRVDPRKRSKPKLLSCALYLHCDFARGNHEREARPVILDKCASRHRSTLRPPTFATPTHVFQACCSP